MNLLVKLHCHRRAGKTESNIRARSRHYQNTASRYINLQVGDNLEFKLLKRDRKAIIAEHASLREGSKKLQSTASSHSGPSTSRQSRDGRVQKAWQSGTVASDESKGRAGLSILEQLNYNHYSKFTQIEDAPLLWKEAAETLAGYASEVMLSADQVVHTLDYIDTAKQNMLREHRELLQGVISYMAIN